MPSLACTQTLRSSKRALWIFLLCAAFCAFTANAMDGNNAAAGPTDISYPDIALQVHPDLDPTATAHAAANWQLCYYIYI